MEILSDPMNLPSTFWDYMVRKWLADAPVFPISQVFGFTGFTFQAATTIAAGEATTSTSYVDLATVGPTLFGLGKGKYAIFFGAQCQPTSPSVALMSISVTNVAAATDADAIVVSAANETCTGVILKDLTNDINGLQAQYRSSGGNSCSFSGRKLIAVKYANI